MSASLFGVNRLLKKSIRYVLAPSATFRLSFIMLKPPEGGILTYGLSTLRFPRSCDLPKVLFNGGNTRRVRFVTLLRNSRMSEIPGGGIWSFLNSLGNASPEGDTILIGTGVQ